MDLDKAMLKFFKKNPDTLLKKATAEKRKGNMEKAIKLLRAAYSEIAKTSLIYPVETFLRLPLYLQQAGKSKEAWEEFNRLLTEGFPNQMKIQELIPMEHSIIYDKMRLFLQREGDNLSAVKFGILSYVSWAIGLYRQERIDELKDHISRENIKKVIIKLLKKAKREDLENVILDLVEKNFKKLPDINIKRLSQEIDQILKPSDVKD